MGGQPALWRRLVVGNGRLIVVLTLLAYVWHALLFVLGGRIAPGGLVILALAPLLIAPLDAMWTSVRLMRRTRERHVSLQGGAFAAWRLVIRDLVGVVVRVLVFSALVLVGVVLLFRASLGPAGLVDLLPIPALDWIFGFVARVYAVGLLFTLLAAANSQFSYLFSRLGEQYRWLMGAWVFVIVTWIGLRVIPIFADILGGLPDFVFDEVYAVGDVYEFRTIMVDSGPFWAVLLFTIALTVASAYMFAAAPERERELLAPGGASS